MKITKIITHNGVHHTDEIFAIALLLEFVNPSLEIIRTREITSEMLANPDIFVIDQGGEYDTILHNFDHHQDENLPASNVLILEWLFENLFITSAFYKEILKYYTAISNIDKSGEKEATGFQVNSLIKSLNSLPDGFNISITIARAFILSIGKFVNKIGNSLLIMEESELITPSCRFVTEFPIHWKRSTKEPFLLEEVSKEEYKLHSRDKDHYPIIPTGKETFFHNNQFLAIYNNKEDALASAINLDKILTGNNPIL